MNRFAVVAVLAGCSMGSCLPAAAADLGTIPEFSLADVAGVVQQRQTWHDRKAVVFCFLGTECPVSNGYAPQMQRLAEKFAAREVAFVGVYSEPTVTADEARKHGEEYALKFPRLMDAEQQLAVAAGVKRVPTFVVAKPDGTIVYRGRLDDRWSPEGRRRNEPTTHELADAIEAVLAGREPPVRETPTFGCPLQKR